MNTIQLFSDAWSSLTKDWDFQGFKSDLNNDVTLLVQAILSKLYPN